DFLGLDEQRLAVLGIRHARGVLLRGVGVLDPARGERAAHQRLWVRLLVELHHVAVLENVFVLAVDHRLLERLFDLGGRRRLGRGRRRFFLLRRRRCHFLLLDRRRRVVRRFFRRLRNHLFLRSVRAALAARGEHYQDQSSLHAAETTLIRK